MATTKLLVLPEAPVWVLEGQGSGSGPAAAIAGRLGVPFRHIGPSGPDGRVAAGSLPELVISSGLKSGARALLLRARHRCRIVHCARSWKIPARMAGHPFDMMVLPSDDAPMNEKTFAETVTSRTSGRDAVSVVKAGAGGRLMPVLGMPHVVSPALLGRARLLWAERLEHLPSPRIVVLLGDRAPNLREAVGLARQLAGMARSRGGCVLATAMPECRPEVSDAFMAGLSTCLHLFHRAGEPGDDPTLGFLGSADAVVAAWTGAQTLSEACAASAPIFVVPSLAGRTDDYGPRLAERLIALDQVRPLKDSLSPWPRTPLDEAGRIARAILGRYVNPRSTR